MTGPFNLFGFLSRDETQAAITQQAPQQQDFEQHRSAVLERAELAVVDQHGRRLNERRWRDHMEFIGSL